MATSPLNVPIPSIDELTQNNIRLLQQSLADAAQSTRPEQAAPAELALARSNTRALSFVLGLGLHGVYRFLRDRIAPQAIPIKASKTFLDGWLETYGMTRKGASHAFGAAVGSGVAGAVLPAGSLLQSADGEQYKTTAAASVASSGGLAVQLIALTAGLAGNAAAGTQLTLLSPVNGIDSGFVADAVSGLSGGADLETDTEAVYRLQQRLANEPMGGSPADYARWALQVAGITRAWGVRNPAGATSAGVVIMADGNADNHGLPTEAQRQQVHDYIADPRRGPPDELFVIVPKAVITRWQIRLDPDTVETRAAARAAILDVYYREAVPGRSIPLSHFAEALSAVSGEYNHTIVQPAFASGALLLSGGFDCLLMPGAIDFVAP